MNTENYMIRFYPIVRISDYPWVYYDRYETYLPKKNHRDEMGHQRTGPMDCAGFDRLLDDIKENGKENPFIIEYYCKDLPNAKGLRDAPVLAIRTGNNCAEAMAQLGMSYASALFVVPTTQLPRLPTDPYVDIPIDVELQRTISSLWKDLPRGNDEPVGLKGAWQDSELLIDLIRSTKEK